MELSPQARERLARIGALSPEENENMMRSSSLDSMLSQYFKGVISSEELWKELKALRDQSGESIAKEAQNKLIDTLRLQMNQADFEQRRSAILAIETMKEDGKYTTLELISNSIESLRQKYQQQKEQAYKQLKAAVERQLQAATQQALKQGMHIDMESSLEANVKASPQWKDFISSHDKANEEIFNSYIDKLRAILE